MNSDVSRTSRRLYPAGSVALTSCSRLLTSLTTSTVLVPDWRRTWSRTVPALELAPQDFVRVLRDVADRLARAQREAEDRRRVRIEPIDARLLDRLRQLRQHAVDLVAHFLRRDVGVLVEQERDHHLRDAFRRHRPQLVDA